MNHQTSWVEPPAGMTWEMKEPPTSPVDQSAISPPRLSIVIPTHQRSDLLRLCLRSLARHAPTNTEIIIVDDGSARAVASALAKTFTGNQVLRLPRQRGFCAAANAGIVAARGTIVELLNDDTEVITPRFLHDMVGLASQPGKGSTFTFTLPARHESP